MAKAKLRPAFSTNIVYLWIFFKFCCLLCWNEASTAVECECYAPHSANKLLQAKAESASKIKTLTLRTTSRRRKHTNEAQKKKKVQKRKETAAVTDFIQDAYIFLSDSLIRTCNHPTHFEGAMWNDKENFLFFFSHAQLLARLLIQNHERRKNNMNSSNSWWIDFVRFCC